MARYGFGPAVYPGYLEGRYANERLLAAELQNQQEQDIRRASLASIADASGADPTTATIMALSGGAQSQPGFAGGQFGPQNNYGVNNPPPASAGRPVDSSYMDPSGMQTMPDNGARPAPQTLPAQTGAAMPTGQPMGGPQPAAAPGARPPGAPPLATMPGGQMSLGQMFQRLRSDPRNQGIPDATLFQFAQKAQQAMFPADRALLQYMLGQDRIGAQMRGQDLTAAYRDAMAAIAQQKADQPNMNFIPGMGQGPDGKPTFGIYRVDKKTGNIGFQPTQGAVGPQAVAAAAGEISDETAKHLWERYKAGDPSALTGLGNGMLGARNREKVLKQGESSGASGTDIARARIDFAGANAASKSVATQAAKIDVGANELMEFAPLLENALDRLDRTKYPNVNAVMNAWARGTGDETVIEIGDYINAIQNAYKQIAQRGGQSTEGAQHRAEQVLNQNWSSGQIRKGLEVLKTEAEAAMRAADKTRGSVTGRIGGQGGQTQPTQPAAPTVSNW